MKARSLRDAVRRDQRVAFGGLAEASTLDCSGYVVARATKISRFGCFLQTTSQLEIGCKVSLKITRAADEFHATGEVVHVEQGSGLGIAFDEFSPQDRATLNHWLGEVGAEEFSPPKRQSAAIVPFRSAGRTKH